MNTRFKVFASYNILQYLCDFIHVLIFVTVSKCQKSPKLTNIVINTTVPVMQDRSSTTKSGPKSVLLAALHVIHILPFPNHDRTNETGQCLPVPWCKFRSPRHKFQKRLPAPNYCTIILPTIDSKSLTTAPRFHATHHHIPVICTGQHFILLFNLRLWGLQYILLSSNLGYEIGK
jgi:hypothetical protein